MKDPSHALGVETGVYRVKFGFAYFGMYALCLALSGLGILMFMGVASVGEKIGAAIFTVFLSLPLVFLVLRTVPAIFDELRVFENGFTYKSRKGIATCLWSQVKDRAGILDVDNRIKVASVEKRNKEKIVFAFGMRGLDVIARELDKYEFSKIPASEKITAAEAAALEPKDLGTLRATYRVKNSVAELIPLAMLLLLVGLGVLLPVANENLWLIPACSVPLALPFCIYAWMLIKGRKDELAVHENGFIYTSANVPVTCFWHEIEDYSLVRRSPEISAIKKRNGPWITIAHNMGGQDELRPHLRTVVKAPVQD